MNQIKQILALMEQPAFCAENGVIVAVNDAAQLRQFLPGMEVAPLLTSGQAEYQEFSSGCLCLTLECSGEHYDARVTPLNTHHIFSLESQSVDSELQLLNLAAKELREPLGNIIALMDTMPGQSDTMAGVNRGLYQLLRLVGNMSSQLSPRMELVDVTALMEELWDKVSVICADQPFRLIFRNASKSIYSYVDSDLLTRAVHNLLSNALKFTKPQGDILLSVSIAGRAYRITMINSAQVDIPLHTAFSRFRREPGLGDGKSGLGLGLKIVRHAALSHGGTALMDEPPGGGVRVTMTMPIRQHTTGLRSNRYHISYSGDYDPTLVELSEVLPPEFYRK